MGERALESHALLPQQPNCGTLPILPHHDPGLAISTTIWAKRNIPQCVLKQETAAVIEQRRSGFLLIFTDGAAAAACVVPALGLHEQCIGPFSASSTTAELAAITLVADQLAEPLPLPAAVLCVSRSALRVPIAQRLPRKVVVIVWSGCDVIF
ncbi:hypothetical protein MRX96_036926 [Rhipicephalus microplus]